MKKIVAILTLVLSIGIDFGNATPTVPDNPQDTLGVQQKSDGITPEQILGALGDLLNAADGTAPNPGGFPMPPAPQPVQPGEFHNGQHSGGNDHHQSGYQSYGDLKGQCPDFDHSQFIAAKAFAVSDRGINHYPTQATKWALKYNKTHACGTIAEYSARYMELYDYGFREQYLNMRPSNAHEYASRYAESLTVPQIQEWKRMFKPVYKFFFAAEYLNNDSSTARAAARTWNERGNCGDMSVVEWMKSEYVRQYDFAFSESGLNYNYRHAKQYGLDAIRNSVPCGNLLR